MKNTHNKKNSKKLKIITLAFGVGILSTAIIAPLVVKNYKNSNFIATNNSTFTTKSLNKFANDSFIQKSANNKPSEFATVNSLKAYTFPILSANNKTNVTGDSLQNLYNINGSSIMYATATGTTGINSIVSINQQNNDMNWAITTSNIVAAVNSFAGSNNGSQITTIFSFNKMIYSPASNSVFIDLYVGTHNGASVGHTVIMQITNINSIASIQTYFDASTNSSSLNSFKQSNFSQFVIEQDSSTPLLYLIKNKYTWADKSTAANGSISFNLVTFAASRNKLIGSVIQTPLNLSGSNINFLSSSSDNALYATSSYWITNGGGGLMLILSRNNISNLNDFATMYAFAASGTSFLNAPNSKNINLSSSNFSNTQPVILNLEILNSKLFLIGSQSNGNASSTAFNSNGSIASFELGLSINGNNANISMQSFSNNNFSYGNGKQVLGIANISNSSNLPSGAQYIVLTENGALVVLNNSFNYLNELGTIPKVFFSNGVSVLHMVSNGVNYLVYLSNGMIIVFNNTGYLGYLSDIYSNNTIQAISPISFIAQNSVTNGIAIFTQPLDQFISNLTTQGNRLIYSLINTSNTFNANYLVQAETTLNTGPNPYSAQVTLNVYQQLTEVNAAGTSASNQFITKVFVGSHTYNIYNKAGSIVANSISNLPASLQNILASQISATEVKQYLLTISNIDQTDIYKNGANNITVDLSSQNDKGILNVSVMIGSYWSNTSGGLVQTQNSTLSFAISGFVIGPSASQLDYTLNPFSDIELKAKYDQISPEDLTIKEVLTNFIKLSTYLANLKGTEINIVPNIPSGTATITIIFTFPNSSYVLPQNSSALLVTQNSITWNTPSVFLIDPTANEKITFNFNSSQYIASNFPTTINNLPSEIQTYLNANTSLSSKINWLVQKGFIIISPFVEEDISSVSVVVSSSSDITGSFSLIIELTNPLPNTLTKTYLYNYSGFEQTPITPSDIDSVFKITNITKDEYNTQFNISNKPNFKSIFDSEPSLITIQDLLNIYENSTNVNRPKGYLISLNTVAASAQYTVTLTPDDTNGSLLVSIVFSEYVEINPKTGAIQIIKNKTFIFVYEGFAKSDNIKIYSLNWKSFSALNPDLKSLSASEAVTIVEKYSAINQLDNFAILSSTAQQQYQNPNQINISLTPNDALGTIIISATFSNWNGDINKQTFTQTFSGFLIPKAIIDKAISTYKPLVSNSAQILDKLKSQVPSNISEKQWLSLFNFQSSILNQLQKIIYVLYNNQTGYVSFVLFVKPPVVPSAIVTGSSTPKTPDTNNIKFIFLQQNNLNEKGTFLNSSNTGGVKPATSITTPTASSSITGLDFSGVPTATLKEKGFVEMAKASNITYGGFQKQENTYTPPNNELAIILGSIIPLVIFIPLILLLTLSKNKKAIRSVRAKINKRLEEEYTKERELEEDEK